MLNNLFMQKLLYLGVNNFVFKKYFHQQHFLGSLNQIFTIQWGSEHRIPKIWKHFKTEYVCVWIWNGPKWKKWSGTRMPFEA